MENFKMSVTKPSEQEISATKTWGTWNKEKSVFDWYYDDTETCYILEGRAEVTDKQGNKIEFATGDMVKFDKGLSCTWKITSPIRKKYRFGD